MATLWARRAHKKPKTQKWTPPSFSARKTTILVQFSPLQVFGNITFKIGSQNSHFGGFYGHFMGPQFPNKPKTPKMDPAILISVKNYYTGSIQLTLGIWDHQNVFQDVLGHPLESSRTIYIPVWMIFPTTFLIFTKNHWAGTQTSPRTHWQVGTRKFTWCQLLTTCDCIPTSDTDINCLFKFTLVKYDIITNIQF